MCQVHHFSWLSLTDMSTLLVSLPQTPPWHGTEWLPSWMRSRTWRGEELAWCPRACGGPPQWEGEETCSGQLLPPDWSTCLMGEPHKEPLPWAEEYSAVEKAKQHLPKGMWRLCAQYMCGMCGMCFVVSCSKWQYLISRLSIHMSKQRTNPCKLTN